MGARIIKTGIAVAITMFICKALNFEPAIFGAISAVINLQPSIFLTFKTAKDQILVHVMGVGMALVFGYIMGGNALSMGLITILLISLYIRLNLHSGITMGIVAALFVLSASSEQFLAQALIRTAVIFTGLITAMVINIFLYPPRYGQQFKEKLKESNLAAVCYFCQAVLDYVQLENDEPDINPQLRDRAHKLNEDTRLLTELLRREGALLTPGTSEKEEWFVLAEKLVDYNEAVTDKADRIYELLPARLERRRKSGVPPISSEFKNIMAMLESGCEIINRVNGKIRSVIIDGISAEPEAISEDYWENLTKAIEQWQPKLTGSYYLHALLEIAVTANEIKWVSRQGKIVLLKSTGKSL